MILAWLTLFTALTVSLAAIYYSVTGLATIFAGAAIAVLIMGTILEISKLVTVVWLHRYWNIASWWLKAYLCGAVVVLMVITSLGIFGGLSKAHIEQTAGAQQTVAQIDRLSNKIEYNLSVIEDNREKLKELQDSGSSVEKNIQEQIQAVQQRIDTAYERVQPAIEQQREIIADQTRNRQRQVDVIDQNLNQLDSYIANDEIEKAQAVIGVNVDGDYGPNTAEAYREYRTAQQERKKELVNEIASSLEDNLTVQRARNRIQQLEQQVEAQVTQASETIKQLRKRQDNSTSLNVEALIEKHNTRVQQATAVVEELTEEKFELENSYRQLEAEVGPVKYIAEFVYGEDADRDMLETAVQWIIVFIIFVFDPLAVLLLIASQYTFVHLRNKDPIQNDNLMYDDLSDEEKEDHIKKVREYIKKLDNEEVDNNTSVNKDTENKYRDMVNKSEIDDEENSDLEEPENNKGDESPYKLHNLDKPKKSSRFNWLPNKK